ncbi:hypothetical protein ACI6LE_001229, partial [Cronobacter sakazakii]
MKMFHGVWAGIVSKRIAAGFLNCNRTKAGAFRRHPVTGNGRPAGGLLPVTVAGRFAGLHRVYSARRRSPLLTGIQKSPMLSHEAFPF